jgi:hypothetical protein
MFDSIAVHARECEAAKAFCTYCGETLDIWEDISCDENEGHQIPSIHTCHT